jgi:hypothetical protein
MRDDPPPSVITALHRLINVTAWTVDTTKRFTGKRNRQERSAAHFKKMFPNSPGGLRETTKRFCTDGLLPAGNYSNMFWVYDGVSKSFRTGHLERELQMVQLSATRYSCIAILWVSLVIFAAILLCVASQWWLLLLLLLLFRYRLSPETFGYTLVCSSLIIASSRRHTSDGI